MHSLETCAVIAAYLASVGVALEFSHRLYWRLSQYTQSIKTSTVFVTMLAAAFACIPLVAAVMVTAAFVALINRKPLVSIGLVPDPSTPYNIIYGAAIALGCVTLAFLIGVLTGHIRVRRCGLDGDMRSTVPGFIEGIVGFFTGATFEELVFRGYVFYVLQTQFTSMVAIMASSLLFSSAHLIKHRQVPVLFTLNAFLFGLVAAVCRHYTGSLWLPIGLHFGWNVVSGSILGLPYSGRTYDRGVVACDVSGPAWLTGGLNSLDAGVLGTLALALAAIGLLAVVPFH